MLRRVLRVKFCDSEEEVNNFLKHLPLEEYNKKDDNIDGKASKLYRITYLPKQNANGDSNNFEIKSSVISIIEYWDYDYNFKEDK